MKISPITVTVICVAAGLVYIIIKQYRDSRKLQSQLVLLEKHVASTVIMTASMKEATVTLAKNQKGIAEKLVEQSSAVNGIATMAGRTDALVKTTLQKTSAFQSIQDTALSGKEVPALSIPAIETTPLKETISEATKTEETKILSNEEIDRRFSAEKAATAAQKRQEHEAERKSKSLVDPSINKMINQTEERRRAIEEERERRKQEQSLFDMLAIAETS